MTLPYNDDEELFDEYTSLQDLLDGDWLAPRRDLSDPSNSVNRGKIHFFTEENDLSVCAHRLGSDRDMLYRYSKQTLEGEDQPDPRRLCALCTRIRFQHRAQPKINQVKTAHQAETILELPTDMTPVPRAAVMALFDANRYPVATFVITRFHGLQDGVARFSVDCDLERTSQLNRTLNLALQDYDGPIEFLVPDEDTSPELIKTVMQKQQRPSKKKGQSLPARRLRPADPSLVGPGPDGSTYSLNKIFG